jgi:hypothetical protein
VNVDGDVIDKVAIHGYNTSSYSLLYAFAV